jgi:hypothetical protein
MLNRLTIRAPESDGTIAKIFSQCARAPCTSHREWVTSTLLHLADVASFVHIPNRPEEVAAPVRRRISNEATTTTTTTTPAPGLHDQRSNRRFEDRAHQDLRSYRERLATREKIRQQNFDFEGRSSGLIEELAELHALVLL